ncbi:extracellular solute-binding protein [Phytomonospora sp. NPDC050363]|uniref:ABC transporter substrate-binding protein n=1 Tax=Phytomonospora sp. NPDC050363 TaxID=3155642 RepID=UPI003403723E
MRLSHQRLNRRRLLALGGLAAVGAATTACGSNTGRDGGDPNKVDLSQWYHQYGEAGTQDAATRYATEYPDANVSIQWIPGDYDAKLASGLLSEDGPDVFESHFNSQMATSGQVVPLDDIMADFKSDFSEIDLFENTWDGKVYGVKMIDDPQLFYYRKSMLTEAGLAVPTTFDELIAAADALTGKTVKGLYLGNTAGAGVLNRPLLWSAGQDLLTADNKIGFGGETTIAALAKFRTLHENGSLLLGAPTDWWDSAAFTQGLCAMQWCGMWHMPLIQEALGDDFGVFPMPPVFAPADGGRPSIVNGGWSTFVSAKSKNVEAAKAFVKWLWLEQVAHQEDWALSYGFHIPPRKSLAAKATKLQSGTAAETVALSQQYGIGANPAWTTTMNTALNDLVTKVVREGADATAELATATGKIDDELAKAGG